MAVLTGVERDSAAGGLIPPRRRDQPTPLSFTQQRIWFLDQLTPGSTAYHLIRRVRLPGDPDLTALEMALNEIVRRHDSLRTTFVAEAGVPAQVVAPQMRVELPVTDLRTLPADRQQRSQRRLTQALFGGPFDLAAGPLFRLHLVQTAQGSSLLICVMHHIISDGWSMGVFERELRDLYEAFAAGLPSPLPELPIQYPDYAAWQREWMAGEVFESHLEYWKRQLSGVPEVLELPTDRPRPALPSQRGASLSFELGRELSAELEELSRREGVTPYMTFLAAFDVLLHRYGGQEDIVVGSAVAGRNRTEFEALIGYFANTVVVRTDLSGDPSFRELLWRVREVALDAYAHQELPFERLVAELAPDRNLSHSPIFQVLFVLQNASGAAIMPAGPPSTAGSPARSGRMAKYDLTLTVVPGDDGFSGGLEYSTDLFDAATVYRMIGHLRALLASAVGDPGLRVSRMPLMAETERTQVVVEWNRTSHRYRAGTTLHGLIEAQAEQCPDTMAACFDADELTYRQLDQASNRLARYLRSLGVGPEVPVGISLERSLDLVVGLLAILKAGGAYVPLDPSYPGDRLEYMLASSGIRVLLTHEELGERLPAHSARLVRLDRDRALWAELSPDRLEPLAKPANLAYVIYTSGSTGRPKGVMIEHRAICNSLLWMQERFRLGETDRALQRSPCGFDLSVWELFCPLVAGAALVLSRPAAQRDSEYLVKLIQERRITTMYIVPSLLAMLLSEPDFDACTSIKQVICIGEALPSELKEEFLSRTEATLHNHYGPTEAAVGVTAALCQPGSPSEAVSIGRPMANTQIYILDSNLQPVPIGVPGELHIGGANLARGYLNRPDLTAEKFIPNPFSSHPGDRLYKAGDLAKYRADGSLEYIGRIDHQVKLRGFRIELGEIEAALTSSDEVADAVALLREDAPGDRRLVAYAVPSPGGEPDPERLRANLRERLPDYMVPSALVLLERLPLTPNGKVDRKALPAPERGAGVAGGYVSPRGTDEAAIAEIWASVLSVDRVGVNDNFFDLGGHSLLATQVTARIRDRLAADLPLRALFEAPTVALLATRLPEGRRRFAEVGPALARLPNPVPSNQDAPERRQTPISFGQERLWFLNQIAPGSDAYNVTSHHSFRGTVDAPALRRSLREVIHRHEPLRTTFRAPDGRPVQSIAPSLDIQLPVTDLRRRSEAARRAELRRAAREQSREPFDLSRGPLLRARLVLLSDRSSVLLVTMHHIVTDGWSMGIFRRELRSLYEAFSAGRPSPLPRLPLRYSDFAAWQRALLVGPEISRQLGYWKEQLAGAPALLKLPTDQPRPAVQKGGGGRQPLDLGGELSDGLKRLARGAEATTYMALLAALGLFLGRYSGQEDVVVGSPIAGRPRTELEGLIGLFANTLALRIDLSGNPSFEEVLRRVRAVALGAYAHQDLPFERIVEELSPERDLSHAPVFQVLFVLQNATRRARTAGQLGPERRRASAKFDLTINLGDTPQGLQGWIEYRSDLFEQATIARMAANFKTLLAAIVAEPQTPVGSLAIVSAAEARRVLVDLNRTPHPYRSEATLHQLFEEQVERTPEAPAITFGGGSMSFHELNARANRLAHHLREIGVRPETLVGVCVERSFEMVVALLGVLKAGGAYVPLDPNLPGERLAHMLNDARAPVLLTQRALKSALPRTRARIFRLDSDWHLVARRSAQNPRPLAGPDNPVYVMYTSGSTGKPKGVVVLHRGIVNHMCWRQREHCLEAADVALHKATLSFDAAVWELFWPLLNGVRVVIAPPGGHPDPGTLRKLVRQEGITVLHFVPSTLQLFLDEPGLREACRSVRYVVSGGEALPTELKDRVHAVLDADLYQSYGPTETSIATIFHRTRRGVRERLVPIGRPIDNTQVYLLDRNLMPVPIGVPGEVHIGGESLARGYHNQPGLTTQRFIPNPIPGAPSPRLYRTGDLARYLPDGNLEFAGRTDNQVKIRGVRIELGEIESVLLRHPAAREVVVVVDEDERREKRLVAYVGTGETANRGLIGALRMHLKRHLPDYMIPSFFVLLPGLPLNPLGKVDRRALPPMDAVLEAERSEAYVPPAPGTEARLAEIWAGVLAVDRVGAHDNFFEIGGHSLLATQVVSRIRDQLGQELDLRRIFETPTVAALAATMPPQLLSD